MKIHLIGSLRRPCRLSGAFLILLLLSSISCHEQSEPNNMVSGTYYGILPCADCPGIHYQLSLNPDSTYTEKYRYENAGESLFQHSGRYTVSNDTVVWLRDKSKSSGMRFFRIQDSTLTMLTRLGKSIQSDLAGQYTLRQTPPTGFSLSVHQNPSEHIFLATGNEPFWMVKIFSNRTLEFKTIDRYEFQLTGSLATSSHSTSNDTTRYRSNIGEGQLQIEVIHQRCQDSMSGKHYEYKTNLYFEYSKKDTLLIYQGCGRGNLLK